MRAIGLDPACRSLSLTADGYGITDDCIRFGATKELIGMLRQMLVEARSFHKVNDKKGNSRKALDICECRESAASKRPAGRGIWPRGTTNLTRF